ncbi:MAG: NADH-quinone oxidoreductase subunit H [Candidatus Altiarchaeota archaeon]|nr:NADH-quinone oxidoreductase subunit H [Candidatus Altiarchaeota archaeon]
MNHSFIAYALVNTAFALAFSPLFVSMIKKVKAFTQGRQGPPLLQFYYIIAKLFRKERVYSSNSSWLMRATPYIVISSTLAATLFVPFLFIPSPMAGIGKIILLKYNLAAGRFFMALAGLDAGSTFGGMGSSREMSISAVIEPITIIAFAALAFTLNTTSIHEMFERTSSSVPFLNPAVVLISVSLFLILIVETARIPIDNPETHLELTMIHEAMLLEYSGRDLALMEVAHALKQTLLMGILINILLPFGLSQGLAAGGIIVAAVLFIAKASLLSVLVGLFESSLAKFRLFSLPGLFAMVFFLSSVTILLEVFK